MVFPDVYDNVGSLHATIDQAPSYRQHGDARGCAHADAVGHHAHAHENEFFAMQPVDQPDTKRNHQRRGCQFQQRFISG